MRVNKFPFTKMQYNMMIFRICLTFFLCFYFCRAFSLRFYSANLHNVPKTEFFARLVPTWESKMKIQTLLHSIVHRIYLLIFFYIYISIEKRIFLFIFIVNIPLYVEYNFFCCPVKKSIISYNVK